MNCDELLQQLCSHVDSEIVGEELESVIDHLEQCSECRAASLEMAQLKRLIKAKALAPSPPDGFAARVLRRVRLENVASESPPSSSGSLVGERGRRVVLSLAAVVALACVAWTIPSVLDLWPPPRVLAHPDCVQEMTRQYENTRQVPVTIASIQNLAKEELVAKIREETGIELEAIPSIGKAHLISFGRVSILGRPGLRLDYRDECAPNKKCPRSIISVFAMPLDGVELPGKLVLDVEKAFKCQCVPVNNLTIYCFRDTKTALNLITWRPAGEMDSRLDRQIAVAD